MPHEVIMPALGMAQDTGLIVAWHKSVGDAVKTGDVLFEVETDKATMEVGAQVDGFVTGIRHDAGEAVPVGQVIALIGDEADIGKGAERPAECAATDAPAPAASTELPEGQTVIMPALGMAQDTGLIVAWHKAPGDAVTASDILFEVETDKSTMEVEAGFDGYVAALLAQAGEEAPVGETIAVISKDKPENAFQISRASAAPARPAATPASDPEAKPGAAEAPSRLAPRKPVPASADGRVLASPKARRLAREQRLDLQRLVHAGHRQPYHVSDLDILKALPAGTADAPQAAARHLTATVGADGFDGFATWAAESAGLRDEVALLAGLAAGSLGRDRTTVAVELFGQTRTYDVPAGPLGAITGAGDDAMPDLRLRDLRFSRVSAVQMGAEDAPVLTLSRDGKGLCVTLECAAHHLPATEAVNLISNFAGRMEQPLRHLL